jgi:hypothetical protein
MRIGVMVAIGMAAGMAVAGWIVDGVPSRWVGLPEVAAEGESYPVLVLELGGPWTDFELKASTNNFESLVYYYTGWAAGGEMGDGGVWVYFTDDYAADVRQWRKSEWLTAIGAQLADGVNSEVRYVVVCPSHTCGVDWRTWMSRDNEKLVWSYARVDGIGMEMNATGTKTRWNAVVPVAWRAARVAP